MGNKKNILIGITKIPRARTSAKRTPQRPPPHPMDEHLEGIRRHGGELASRLTWIRADIATMRRARCPKNRNAFKDVAGRTLESLAEEARKIIAHCDSLMQHLKDA